eukprot:TRINITY_DN9304_c0_g1_i3.p1 TRINITY_DN9304_c0_g1~~TRINITY_DN9304_c0_g1_i3.p1  ORF type:complete len:195 (+),score=22.14 TRINITY_DN9304_c0_g1_i3:204-788(+)
MGAKKGVRKDRLEKRGTGVEWRGGVGTVSVTAGGSSEYVDRPDIKVQKETGKAACEVFSGEGGLSAALSQLGIKCKKFDLLIDAAHDMSSKSVCEMIYKMVSGSERPYVHFAIPCCSYSNARFLKIRSKEYLEGKPNLDAKDQRVVETSNLISDNAIALATHLADDGCLVSIENPTSSLTSAYNKTLVSQLCIC